MKISRFLVLGFVLTISNYAAAEFEDFYHGRIWTVYIVDSGPHFVENDKLMLLQTTEGDIRAIPLEGMLERPAWRTLRGGLTLKRITLNAEQYLCADDVYLHDARAHVFILKLKEGDPRRMVIQYNDKDSGADCYTMPTHGGVIHLR